jgi:hypothetical protein
LTEPLAVEVESFVMSEVKRTNQPFLGGEQVKVAGQFKSEQVTFAAGTILVRAGQPLGILAACLLEPESDDGLVTWGFLNTYLDRGKTFPIYKAMHEIKTPSRLVDSR